MASWLFLSLRRDFLSSQSRRCRFKIEHKTRAELSSLNPALRLFLVQNQVFFLGKSTKSHSQLSVQPQSVLPLALGLDWSHSVSTVHFAKHRPSDAVANLCERLALLGTRYRWCLEKTLVQSVKRVIFRPSR
ncbi:MAG: hypothetical protein CBB71_05920 [Rhodopirellula sp. TMED11]|nr:MAG: hypothetical protein CBB71_05920 [Rhodopirellula sp. TMED11]